LFFFVFLSFLLDVYFLFFLFLFLFLCILLVLVAAHCVAVAAVFVAVAVSFDDFVMCLASVGASNHDRRQQFLCLCFFRSFGVGHGASDGSAVDALAPLARRQ
jgi:hypothetical protein